MNTLHPLLKRQLRRHFSSPAHQARSWAALLKSVNEAYEQADIDRQMLERSLDLTSSELVQAHTLLRAASGAGGAAPSNRNGRERSLTEST